MNRFMLVSVLLASVLACGGEQPSVPAEPADVTVTLMPVDSIGIEMGDSCYVLGAVEGVAYGPDGNIAVLDCAMSCIRIYSPEGEFLRQIGRRGNGPGEMQSVAFLGISEDGHIFLAGEGSETLGLHQYDYSTGEWLGSMSTLGTPPTCIEGSSDSSYVRKNVELDMSTGEPIVVMSVSRYRAGSEEPLATYLERSFPFDPSDYATLIGIVWYGVDIAADFAGDVWISERSSEEAVAVRYGQDGTETGRVTLDLEPVLRTPEELEMERLILTSKAIAMDSDEFPPIVPDPYKPMITGLELDGEGNLWVQLGGPATPTFEVFSPDGEPLYTAVLGQERADGASWRFFIDEHGILAYAEDPADGYQKVYVLELR
jgi:hypothetical protein